MTSIVDICNSALNMIGATNIIALTEDSKSARVCNQRFANVRDAVMRAHPWNCLIKRTTIAADTETPAFTFAYQYTLPTDPYCLRVLHLDYHDLEYKVEGRKIMTDEGTLNLVYLARVTDPNEYDMLLVEAMAARLAADVSFNLANSSSLTPVMWDLYTKKLAEARFVDASEGTPGVLTDGVAASGALQSDVLINSRY